VSVIEGEGEHVHNWEENLWHN